MKLLDNLLFIYSGLFALAITVAAILNRQDGSHTLIIIALFLPVILYLIYQVVITLYRRKYIPNPTPNQPTSQPAKLKLVSLPPKKGFFHQKSPAFLITLALFISAFTTIIALSILTPQSTAQAAIHHN